MCACLLVLTYRPEFIPWSGVYHVTTHTLNRLSRQQVATMVGRVTGGQSATSGGARPDCYQEQTGCRCLSEELTKTVLELGLLTDDGARYRLTVPCHRWRSPTRCTAVDGPSDLSHQSGKPHKSQHDRQKLPMNSLPPCLPCLRPSCTRPCASSPADRNWSFAVVSHRQPLTCSSMPWSRTPPTAHC